MTAERRCLQCRALLRADDDARCMNCTPSLDPIARAAGIATRRRIAEMALQERGIKQIETDIRRAERALRKW
jgi:hypothetical protein